MRIGLIRLDCFSGRGSIMYKIQDRDRIGLRAYGIGVWEDRHTLFLIFIHGGEIRFIWSGTGWMWNGCGKNVDGILAVYVNMGVNEGRL